MAISDSVTVSMGEETRGAFKVIFLDSAEVRSWKLKIVSFLSGKISISFYKQGIFNFGNGKNTYW